MYRTSYESPERDKLYPSFLFCEHFDVGTCCTGCHEQKFRITVYPHSCYSEGKPDPLPDCGLGILAEVCCGRYEAVRALTREFWLRVYAKKQGYTDVETTRLLTASADKFFRVWSEIGSERFQRNSSGSSVLGRGVRVESRPQRVSSGRVSVQKCPACGQRWHGEVCDNCGHGAGI